MAVLDLKPERPSAGDSGTRELASARGLVKRLDVVIFEALLEGAQP
jgi:hypothetical protein